MSQFFLLLDPASNQLYQHLITEQQTCSINQPSPKESANAVKNSFASSALRQQNITARACTNWPVNFDQINAYLPDQDKPLRALLEPLSTELIEAGATRVLIPNITLSLVFRRLRLLKTQLVDPVSLLHKHLISLNSSSDLTVKPNNHQFRVFGGKHTAHSKVWSQATERTTWTFCPTEKDESERVDEIRRATFTKASDDKGWLKSAAVELASLMEQDHSKMNILACSELSRIFQQNRNCFSSLRVIDVAELQTAAFIR